VIALMFILGTSSVLAFVGTQPINVIGPIPQTFRLAFGNSGWAAPFGIFLILARAVAGASLVFTGLTRLPMTAGWDNLMPQWLTRLDPRRRTPVNSIFLMTALVMALIFLSMLGVREQEANQLLAMASVVHYAIAYISLFALPLFGRAAFRAGLPRWIRFAAAAGLFASLVALVIAAYPIVEVVDRAGYAARICAVVVVSNAIGVLLYRAGRRRASR
jgi:amino acid transporter